MPGRAACRVFSCADLSKTRPGPPRSPLRLRIAQLTEHSSRRGRFLPNEPNRRNLLSLRELSVRLASHSAIARQGSAQVTLPVASPNTGRSQEASHAIFEDQNGSGLGLDSPPDCLISLCYCRDRPVRVPVIFSASPHFSATSCAPPCIFPVNNREST